MPAGGGSVVCERGKCGLILLVGVNSNRTASGPAAHGFALELDAVGVVDEAVEDGIGEGGLADHLVPGVDGQLAGDDGASRGRAGRR